MNKETIFALATIFGKSGVAVIRISGAEATKVFSYFQVKKKIIPRVATLVTLYDSQGFPLDKCLIIWFKSPHSFTGEGVVEFHIHGSKGVIKSLIEELGKIFRLAEPGEFSRRAFENNKLDLTEAEGLVDLIEAETKMQSRQALRQISGALRSLYDGWRISLIRIMAGLEAYIDFPDEGIPQEAVSHGEISQLIQEMENHLADNKRGQKLRSGFRIAIAGRPNVGKSTLFNYLVKKDMAITSNIPGTTRDVLEAQIDLDGYPVTICDTAGIQGTLDPIELEGIIRAKKCAQESDMVLALLPYKDLRTMGNNIKLSTNNSILLASKADELTSVTKILIQDKELLPISVKTGSGLETLVTMIKTQISDEIGLSEAPIITRERHRKAVALAVDHLKRYNGQDDLILAAEDLRVAAKTLGQITGDIRIDDVLGELFSKFCVGK